MLEAMAGLPPGVLGFKVDGALHADDYRQVLLPAVEAAIQRGEKVRIVLVFEGFDGLSGGALWQDLKLGSSTSPTGSASRWSPTSTG
jgi:hypothetical protein